MKIAETQYLIQLDTAINCKFHLIAFQEARDGLITQPNTDKLVGNVLLKTKIKSFRKQENTFSHSRSHLQEWVVFCYRVGQFLQISVIFDVVVAFHCPTHMSLDIHISAKKTKNSQPNLLIFRPCE